MYKIVSIIGVLIRQKLFTPLSQLTFLQSVNYYGVDMSLFYITLTNLFLEGVLRKFTFWIVGFYYQKGYHSPTWGSFLYLAFYVIHNFFTYYIIKFYDTWYILIILGVLYGLIHYIIYFLKIKKMNGSSSQ